MITASLASQEQIVIYCDILARLEELKQQYKNQKQQQQQQQQRSVKDPPRTRTPPLEPLPKAVLIQDKDSIVMHQTPETIKLHKWKPWQPRKEDSTMEVDLPNGINNNNKKKKTKKSSGSYQRKDVNLKRALEKSNSHLNSGTVGTRPLNELLSIIKKCLQNVIRLSSQTKRICQRAIAIYIDHLSKSGVEEDGRKLLDRLCSRVSHGNMSDDEDNEDALNMASTLADEGSDKRSEVDFLPALLHCKYNRTSLATTKSSDDIKRFIDKVKDVLPVMNDPGKIEKMDYPASSFLRSAATRTLMGKGHLPADKLPRIDSNIPVIEIFVRLNKITGNRRKIAPMPSMEDGHICLSELDLIAIF
ncbi:hypothetical protein BGZ51_002409 [Haplosporangium sp. Z 767]|nr:hypothetical protein BGZ51_002409 [Haplosporangium sp. Z 767]